MSDSLEPNDDGATEQDDPTTPESPPIIRAPRAPRSTAVLAGGAFAVMLVAGGLAGALAARVASPAAEAKPHGASWAYDGANGPEHWGEIDPYAAVCKTGEQQSPINVTARRLLQLPWIEPLEARYKPSKARLVNDGHTFQVTYDRGSLLTFLGRDYRLDRIVFHSPSEHEFNSQRAAMELQLVHVSADQYRTLAIVSVLFVEGRENPFLAKFWHQMPEKPGPEIASQITINAADALPRSLAYYHYDGSLTTPPCTEGVKWIVLKEPVQASREQIARLGAVFGPNARPVQPLFDRWVKEEAVGDRR